MKKEFYLKPKIVPALKGYTGGQFVKDLVAGLIVALIFRKIKKRD